LTRRKPRFRELDGKMTNGTGTHPLGAAPSRSQKPCRVLGDSEKMLLLIRTHPGIRPSELNRRLNREQSDGLRDTLIRRGLIRKEKDGRATRYYPV
jgi:hypothetical protein